MYLVFRRTFLRWGRQVGLGGLVKVWQTEGALVMSASPGQGADTQIHGGAFYQSRLLFPSRAGSCPALAGGGDRAPTRGGRGCSCDPKSLKAQPFTLVGVEEVKRCSKYDGCSCPNSESVLVVSRNPKCLFPVVQKHTSPPKAKPNPTKTPSDGDIFQVVSISVGGSLFLFTFRCCWSKRVLNEEYEAPVM